MILKENGKVIEENVSALELIHNHGKRITDHYHHARENHPYFCDMMMPRRAYPDATKEEIRCSLGNVRREIEVEAKEHTLAWDALLNCEMWEVYDALANDDKAQAVEELYDCIAVCLRAIDVLEGRQKLGKPETKGGAA